MSVCRDPSSHDCVIFSSVPGRSKMHAWLDLGVAVQGDRMSGQWGNWDWLKQRTIVFWSGNNFCCPSMLCLSAFVFFIWGIWEPGTVLRPRVFKGRDRRSPHGGRICDISPGLFTKDVTVLIRDLRRLKAVTREGPRARFYFLASWDVALIIKSVGSEADQSSTLDLPHTNYSNWEK